MKQVNFLLFTLFINLVFAQHNTSAELSIINEDGLHEISVPNTIRTFSKNDLSDFRILDSKGNEVPYFIRKKSRSISTNEFIDFEIISKTAVKDTSSVVIFKNPTKTIQEIVVSIANYAGSKRYSLSGSNDQQQWFGLVNNTSLSNLQDYNNTSIYKRISFPLCSYSYLKIVFDDTNSLPVNVLKIGTSTNNITNQELQEVKIKSKAISEISNEKKTQIHITFENKEYLNRILFKIVSPELYNRSVSIYKISSREVKNKTENYKENLANFKLNSDADTIFDMREIFENDIYIEIENNDNTSLVFSDLQFFQEPLYVIADLKTNEKYTIKTGDKKLKAPQYDISFFKNNISSILPKAEIANVLKKENVKNKSEIKSFWQQPWFMWLCIALAGIAILYFTASLVKDLKKD